LSVRHGSRRRIGARVPSTEQPGDDDGMQDMGFGICTGDSGPRLAGRLGADRRRAGRRSKAHRHDQRLRRHRGALPGRLRRAFGRHVVGQRVDGHDACADVRQPGAVPAGRRRAGRRPRRLVCKHRHARRAVDDCARRELRAAVGTRSDHRRERTGGLFLGRLRNG